MEQATSLQESIIVSPWDVWNKQHHLVYGHCMEQTTSLLPWALQEHLHHLYGFMTSTKT
jgi:hypothetical protein